MEKKKNGAEAIFEKIISKHFSKSVKNNNTNSRVLLNPKQDKYKQQNKANKQKTKQKTDLAVSNCWKPTAKRKILKEPEGKTHITLIGTTIRLTANFSVKIREFKERKNDILNLLGEGVTNLEFYTQWKYPPKNVGGVEMFLSKQKLK